MYDTASVLGLARRAAELGAHRLRAAPPETPPSRKGQHGDVVTACDVEIEKAVRRLIAGERAEDMIVGEELALANPDDAALRWYVDPIDGTANYVLGLPHFGTSVAAYDPVNDRWIAGAVSHPPLDRLYWASAGGGAWLSTAGGPPTRLHARRPANAPRVLGGGLSYEPGVRRTQLDQLRRRLGEFDDVRCLGSAALALCLVAAGSLSAYRETDLYVFDWAAGALIAEEAGASVVRGGLGRGSVEAYGGQAPSSPDSPPGPQS